MKIQVEQREYNGNDELYEVMDEILIGFSIETVFVNWMNRLQRLIDRNGDHAS
jgi:hypothetical protein